MKRSIAMLCLLFLTGCLNGGGGPSVDIRPAGGGGNACEATTYQEFLSALATTLTLTATLNSGTDATFTEDQDYDVTVTSTGFVISTDGAPETYDYDENDNTHSFTDNGHEINLIIETTGPTRQLIIQQGCTDADMGFRIYYSDKTTFSWALEE